MVFSVYQTLALALAHTKVHTVYNDVIPNPGYMKKELKKQKKYYTHAQLRADIKLKWRSLARIDYSTGKRDGKKERQRGTRTLLILFLRYVYIAIYLLLYVHHV